MATFYNIVSKTFSPYIKWGLPLILFVLFFLVGYFGYKRFYVNGTEQYRNVANANRRNPEIVIYFFYADWCPHCKEAKPEWVSFSTEYDQQMVNNYRVHCVMVNEADANGVTLLSQYEVDSFPTVILVKDTNTIVYDAKIKKATLESFLMSATTS
jgi:thiol:disulfide interchange protein